MALARHLLEGNESLSVVIAEQRETIRDLEAEVRALA
jgi:hypothetical protein